MTFARDGYPFMALSAAVAVTVIALAVWRRSWSLWLLGFALLLLAASVSWYFNTTAQPVPALPALTQPTP